MSKAEDMQQGITKIQQMHARIATLEAENAKLREMVRELVDAADQCFGNLAISMDDEILWANTRAKVLALLQPEGTG